MQLIPEQYKGRSIRAISSREFPDDPVAQSFFETTRQRLERVNDWLTWAGAALAQFTLVNLDGKDVYRPPIVGDHFKIDVPGPGSAVGTLTFSKLQWQSLTDGLISDYLR